MYIQLNQLVNENLYIYNHVSGYSFTIAAD